MLGFNLPESFHEIERFQETGGDVPAGKYHVILDGVSDANGTNGGTGYELTFKILAGPCAGMEIKDTLWNSENTKAQNRMALFASRLGLIVRGADGKPKFADGKTDFADVRGADCVVEAVREKYTNKKTGKEGMITKLTFNGIWSTNDPAVKGVPKAATKPTVSEQPKTKTSAAL
jgi:hypothetical protein